MRHLFSSLIENGLSEYFLQDFCYIYGMLSLLLYSRVFGEPEIFRQYSPPTSCGSRLFYCNESCEAEVIQGTSLVVLSRLVPSIRYKMKDK